MADTVTEEKKKQIDVSGDQIVDAVAKIPTIEADIKTTASNIEKTNSRIDELESNSDSELVAQVNQNKTDISSVNKKIEDLTENLIDSGVIATPTSYTNLVPTATTGATGNIYNGTGYLNGYRLNSSGNVVEEYPACVTGFMPYTQGATIRIVGATGLPDRGGMYVATYKESYELIAVGETKGYVSDGGALIPRENNAYEFVINTGQLTNQYRIANFTDAKYIRVSCNPCDGSDLIVTINEEAS